MKINGQKFANAQKTVCFLCVQQQGVRKVLNHL